MFGAAIGMPLTITVGLPWLTLKALPLVYVVPRVVAPGAIASR
jgi:hypothetical protein